MMVESISFLGIFYFCYEGKCSFYSNWFKLKYARRYAWLNYNYPYDKNFLPIIFVFQSIT